MVLTKAELLAAAQSEARLVHHLANKVDRSALDYRPTSGQRSTGELVRYLSMMGPTILQYSLGEPPDIEVWMEAERAAENRDFDASVEMIAGHPEVYASLLSGVTDAALRSEIMGFDGKPTSRGAFMVQWVLAGGTAYRTQLFLYLKSSGQTHLNSMNLWSGVDAAPA
jgi:hypothetical protein